MKTIIEVPPYDNENGLTIHWEPGFEIKTGCSNSEILIQANKAGLISLAIQLFTLAQDSVPKNTHYHLDEHNSLEDGSIELIIEKINDI